MGVTASIDRLSVDRSRPITPQVYDHLRQLIVDNRLGPGARLSESMLADALAISRTPLRAALQQLANEGLVKILPQVGSVVAELDNDRLHEAIFIRAALETAVVRKLASAPFDAGPLDTILTIQARTAEIDDYATFFFYDEAFHAKLAEMANVPHAWSLVHSVKGHVDRQRYTMMAGIPMRSQRAYDEHRAILERIAAGDPDGAARAMHDHVHSVLELDMSGPIGGRTAGETPVRTDHNQLTGGNP
ncbi:GntR family transcriptional regulator [Oricola sp.]|uniref:GntR family transcriptional regulator n=1 Tax=Oricola sp. TaxID=1979950 RepID=UPI003BAB8F90